LAAYRSRNSRAGPESIETVRQALRSDAPPVYCRASASKLDPFKDEIHRLLKQTPSDKDPGACHGGGGAVSHGLLVRAVSVPARARARV
jgi:hypothetical protein